MKAATFKARCFSFFCDKVFTKQTRSLFTNIVRIASANTFAQVLIVCAAPIITRQYLPEQFGKFSQYLSLLAIISSFSALRFDAAIPVPRSNRTARSLASLALFSSVIFSSALVVFSLWQVTYLESSTYGVIDQSLFLPFAIVSWACFRVLQQWAVRNQHYAKLAYASVSQILSQLVIQIGCGVLCPSVGSLVMSDLIKAISGVCILKSKGLNSFRIYLNSSRNYLIAAGKRYWKFAVYSSGAAFLNATANWCLPLVIAYFYDLESAGYIGICQRIVGGPTNVISNSVSKVYAGELSDCITTRDSKAKELFITLVGVLSVFGLCLIVLVGAPAIMLAGPIFGEEWSNLGFYIFILSFAYAVKMVAQPVGVTLDLCEAQATHIVREILRVSIILSGILLAVSFDTSPIQAVLIIAVSQSIGHIIAGYIAWLTICRKVSC